MSQFDLNKMQEIQKELQEKYFEKWGGLSPEKGKVKLLWMMIEAGEVADIIKKKGDEAILDDEETRKNFIEEVCDVMMYLNDVLLCYDIKPDEVEKVYLEKHEKVAWVNYPGLASSDQHALAEKYLPKGCCGVISFGVKGGRAKATTFMDSLKLAAVVVHVADARTSVLHPASTTHRQLTDEQLVATGITPDMVRLSVGIENVDDIIADLEQALTNV